MLKNYLKTSLRVLTRQKVFTIVNISGLAVGLACCIMVLLYIRYELTFDRFHDHADEICRILVNYNVPGSDPGLINKTPDILGAKLCEMYPEVVNSVRLGQNNDVLIRYDDAAFNETRVFYAESTFFNVFSFPLVQGDHATALVEPYTVVITEEIAHKLFGDNDPMGKRLRYGSIFDLTVSGVAANVPDNSHIHFDYLISMATRKAHWNEDGSGGYMLGFGGSRDSFEWGKLSAITYLRLAPHTDINALEKKIAGWMQANIPDGIPRDYVVQPLTDIHLGGNAAYEIETNNDLRSVYFLFAIALLILLIACFNYMNLSTARSLHRVKEVGMRKVLGANRSHLMRQFLGESVLITMGAMLVAGCLIEFLLPWFNRFIGRNLVFDVFADYQIWLGMTGLVLVIGVLAGCYPALYLSGFRPIRFLKGSMTVGSGGATAFRNILVIVQYGVSAVLIVGTLIVARQLEFVKNKDKGFTADNVVAVKMDFYQWKKSYQSLIRELKAHPSVREVSGSELLPISAGGGASSVWWEGKGDEKGPFFHWGHVDDNFLNLYGLTLTEGRFFSDQYPSDVDNAVILNEAAVRTFGWESAVGKKFGISPKHVRTVVGVVKDYHFSSFHERIEPMAFMPLDKKSFWLSVKTATDEMNTVIGYLKDHWHDYSITPFEYIIPGEVMMQRYDSEQRLWKLFISSAIIALFIACLGLFGLASFTAERRYRELGTRKILGASSTGLVLLLNRQYVQWIMLANVLALPAAWYVMRRWLDGFAYRIDMQWEVFGVTVLLSLVVSLITVSIQSYRAASINPVEILRRE